MGTRAKARGLSVEELGTSTISAILVLAWMRFATIAWR